MIKVMYYVYLIKSINFPKQKYIGIAENLEERLAEHNAGESFHTSKYMPWVLETYIAFEDKYMAYDFEKYLKSHSGRAFASKRFWQKAA